VQRKIAAKERTTSRNEARRIAANIEWLPDLSRPEK